MDRTVSRCRRTVRPCGSLKGFKADVTVTTVDGTIWHWNGAVSSDD
jgi:hypothetical protein